MGCDIHMVLERKTEHGWLGMHGFNPLPINRYKEGSSELETSWAWWEVTNRNYERFGAMAGVRIEGPEPRGMPEDASDLAVYEAERMVHDGHSHSWLYAGEFIKILCAEEHQPKELRKQHVQGLLDGGDAWFHSVCDRFLGFLDDDASPEDYRVVFFFDN